MLAAAHICVTWNLTLAGLPCWLQAAAAAAWLHELKRQRVQPFTVPPVQAAAQLSEDQRAFMAACVHEFRMRQQQLHDEHRRLLSRLAVCLHPAVTALALQCTSISLQACTHSARLQLQAECQESASARQAQHAVNCSDRPHCSHMCRRPHCTPSPCTRPLLQLPCVCRS